ncbi:DegV family EDD domain-containing protein [bacterium]|nr:DegV family EDD domain-containing protein [bacterium]
MLKGASKAEVLAQLADINHRIHTFAFLSTLKYIALSGRLNKFSANIADSLNIKPILTVQDGKLEVVSRQRTERKALEKMLDLLAASIAGKTIERAAVLHVNCPENALALKQRMSSSAPGVHPYLIAEFTPGLSLHVGSGALGISVLTAS